MRRATAPVPPIAVYNSGRRLAVPTMQDVDVPNVGQLLGMATVGAGSSALCRHDRQLWLIPACFRRGRAVANGFFGRRSLSAFDTEAFLAARRLSISRSAEESASRQPILSRLPASLLRIE